MRSLFFNAINLVEKCNQQGIRTGNYRGGLLTFVLQSTAMEPQLLAVLMRLHLHRPWTQTYLRDSGVGRGVGGALAAFPSSRQQIAKGNC